MIFVDLWNKLLKEYDEIVYIPMSSGLSASCATALDGYKRQVLVGSTVRSYLAWLKDTGRLGSLFENNMLLWQRA